MIYEFFKERRMAAIFFGTFMLLLALLVLGLLFQELTKGDDLTSFWAAGVVIVGICGALFWWRVIRVRRWHRLRDGKCPPIISPLSQDEWVKARRKLAAKPMIRKR